MDRGFLRRWELLLPAVLAPAVETLVLALSGHPHALSLAPQVTAPPPLDLFHDLRWISVYHDSWLILTLEMVVVLGLRALWVAWVVQRSWPDHAPPPMARASLRAVAFLVIAAVLLTPWVVLLFGLALTHLSFLFFAALPPVIAITILIHGGAIKQAAGRWWRWRPSLAGVGWVAASFVWLTFAGAAMRSVPLPAAIAIAAAAGLANARAWYGIVQGIARRPERSRRAVLVPVAVGATFAIAVGGSALGFAVTSGGARIDRGAPPPAPAASPGERPVLVAAGLYSRMRPSSPIALPRGYEGWSYSYRGVDETGRPLPYGPYDTTQPLLVSAGHMAEQVAALADAYGAPVTIVAESAGALIARTYLTRLEPDPGTVDRLIALEMHPGAASVYLPAPGTQGWGVGTGWAMRGLAEVIDDMAPFEATVDAPLMRDLVECRRVLAGIVAGPAPDGVHEVSIEVLADYVDPPARRPAGVAVQVVTAPHAGLLGRAGIQDVIGDLLTGTRTELEETGGSLGTFITAVSSPWRVPELDHGLFPTGDCPLAVRPPG